MPDGIELEPRKVLSLVPKSHRITTDPQTWLEWVTDST